MSIGSIRCVHLNSLVLDVCCIQMFHCSKRAARQMCAEWLGQSPGLSQCGSTDSSTVTSKPPLMTVPSDRSPRPVWYIKQVMPSLSQSSCSALVRGVDVVHESLHVSRWSVKVTINPFDNSCFLLLGNLIIHLLIINASWEWGHVLHLRRRCLNAGYL